jgi:glycosyltransferase involved in cell wall biosynthesis
VVTPFPLFSDRDEAAFRDSGIAGKVVLARRARSALGGRLAALEDGDVVIVQRRADFFPVLGLERRAARGHRLVYDVDDAVWHTRGAGGDRLAFLKGSRRKAAWLASRADQVVAGNELLADWLSRYSSTVMVIPSLVDLDTAPLRSHEDRSKLVLGWIGSTTTAPFIRRLGDAFERVAAALPDREVELRLVGSPPLELSGVSVRAEPWSEETERACLEEMDIGVMPLPDTVFTRGKCAYKAVQYMASGVPVVADDVGITARVIGHGEAGLIATGADQWVDALVALGRDRGMRERLGGRARARVEKRYSVQAWAPTLARAITGPP